MTHLPRPIGTLTCLSAMIHFEMPHINVVTKMDLLDEDPNTEEMEKFFGANTPLLLSELHSSTPERFHHLNQAIAELVCHSDISNI